MASGRRAGQRGQVSWFCSEIVGRLYSKIFDCLIWGSGCFVQKSMVPLKQEQGRLKGRAKAAAGILSGRRQAGESKRASWLVLCRNIQSSTKNECRRYSLLKK